MTALTIRPLLRQPGARQTGVVLIVAMIMLIIVSLLAAIAVRNATSSEGINANLRQTQLATQAAETALRYCEDAAIYVVNDPDGTGTGTDTFTVHAPSPSPPTGAPARLLLTHIRTAPNGTDTPTSTIPANWDTTTDNGQLVLPLATVNLAGVSTTFARPPECMIERARPDVAQSYLSVLTVTARGFGPEVAPADGSRSRPVGSEVWLQSTLELQ